MKNLLDVSSSKGYQGTTRGKAKILMISVGIEPTTSGLDLPLLCRLSYEVGQRKSGTIKVVNRGEEKVRVHIYVVPRSTMNTGCKGVNKKCNEINKDKYLNVLLTKQNSACVNRGFRVVNNTMYTYTQVRDAFSYFYPKRKVLQDGVSTLPLDI